MMIRSLTSSRLAILSVAVLVVAFAGVSAAVLGPVDTHLITQHTPYVGAPPQQFVGVP